MRLAYLCNLYPAVSHSFVRREIEAVERAGHEVHRFSLRPARSDLKDEDDIREDRLTEAVLGGGAARLFGSAIVVSISRPIRSLRALKAAWRLSGPGLAAKARHAIYWLEAAWLFRRFNEIGIEHVHAHFGTNPAAVALLAREFGGPSFSFTVHGPDEFDAPVSLALSKKIDAATFVAAISSYARSQLMRWSTPQQWSKIFLVRCGLDLDFLASPADPVENSTEFVCIARLSAQKGLPLLIAVCQKLRADGLKFNLTIIGDGELRSALEGDIARRNLTDCITFAGTCTASQIRAHLRRARAFVLPSFAEGLPVVLMEALAMGRPVITTAVAGIPELVDRECGWLISAGSADALTTAMREALSASTATLTAMGLVGRNRVRRMHDASRNAAELVQAIASFKLDPQPEPTSSADPGSDFGSAL